MGNTILDMQVDTRAEDTAFIPEFAKPGAVERFNELVKNLESGDVTNLSNTKELSLIEDDNVKFTIKRNTIQEEIPSNVILSGASASDDNGLTENRKNRSYNEWFVFSNFTLELLGKQIQVIDKEDGESQAIYYRFKITVYFRNGEEKPFVTTVESNKVRKFDWITKATGSLAMQPTNKDGKEMFQRLIQQCLETETEHTEILYPTPGWRNIPERGWKYVHGGGVIGENTSSVRVDGGPVLNTGKHQAEKADIFRRALDMTNVCKTRRASTVLFLLVHAAVMATLFKEAKHPINFVYGICGVTNSRKTSLVLALAKLFDRETMVADAEFATATNAGIERTLGRYKDGIVIIDDFKPGVDIMQQKALDAKLDQLCRFYGNRVPKKRMGNFLSEKGPKYYPINGVCAITMEIVTAVTSTLSRMFISEINADEVDNIKLRYYQENAAILPMHMYDFIDWLTPRFDTYVDYIRDNFPLRRESRSYSVARYNEMYATFKITSEIFLIYAVDRRFLYDNDHKMFIDLVKEVLSAEFSGMEERLNDSNKTNIIVDAFEEALHSRRITPIPLNRESCEEKAKCYEDESYFYLEAQTLYKVTTDFSNKNHIERKVVNMNEMFGLLEQEKILDILQTSRSMERSRKLPIQGSNKNRYLYLKKRAIDRYKDSE